MAKHLAPRSIHGGQCICLGEELPPTGHLVCYLEGSGTAESCVVGALGRGRAQQLTLPGGDREGRRSVRGEAVLQRS